MANTPVSVPDLGGIDEVEVIEICVKPGDNIEQEEALIVLESDKATMEVPAPFSGKVTSIKVSVGDKVSTGTQVAEMDQINSEEVANEANELQAPAQIEEVEEQSTVTQTDTNEDTEIDIIVPDLGGIESVEVIELSVTEGDSFSVEDGLLVLESDKATMEVPAPSDGILISFSVKVGDKVSEGDRVGKMKSSASTPASSVQIPIAEKSVQAPKEHPPKTLTSEPMVSSGKVHAGPAVRKLARELGVDLAQVSASGPRSRIQKQDLHDFVKQKVNASVGTVGVKGSDEDFSKYGTITQQPLNKIKQVTARNMVASWSTIPQVTQFDEADITDLEHYRKTKMPSLLEDGVKVSPLAFITKACVKALQVFPEFNSSLGPNADELILKQYYNIGIAVETPDGLLVPVIKQADSKGVVGLAKESSELAKKARDKKLPLDAMSGASFTISSLGGIGGTAFTPIVNAPQVAILGVSKASYKPVWNGEAFEPRLMLPLSLSYDHRVIDGAQAARFTRYICDILSETRHMLL
ncbi:dihydrolipoyllysine-residue acetyltransferase [Oceaniserpentilla sp. 4NH20-0058]|uniref:dihydrolipoyllysine-residue acetyltransferase n=1 Tax=Oceaniserpentilla sp. 4NH20-0058 TaxID=3127660 RepID=UPI00310B1159